MDDGQYEELRDLVVGLGNGLTELRERNRSIAEDVAEVKHLILGNGQPGLVQTTAKLEERMDTVEASTASRWQFRGVAITAVLGLIAAIVTQIGSCS